MIERIRRVPLREVWKHEALDFTTWLEQNLDVLDEYLDFSIDHESVRREQAAGAFAVDLVAEDDSGGTVVIENQLERSDHDHLGKVLTYLAAFDAARAIWIVGDPRPEHVRAVAWLNDSSAASVYLFKIEAIRIGDSRAAPLLTRIVGPSEETARISATKREKSARHASRRAFFEQLLAHAKTRTKLHSGRTGTEGPHLNGPSGHTGVLLTYGVTQHGTSVMLWIDRGPDASRENEAIFQYLLERRSEIEGAFGSELEWQSKAGNRSRKLIHAMSEGGWVDEDGWDTVVETTVDAMIRLEAAVKPHLTTAVIGGAIEGAAQLVEDGVAID